MSECQARTSRVNERKRVLLSTGKRQDSSERVSQCLRGFSVAEKGCPQNKANVSLTNTSCRAKECEECVGVVQLLGCSEQHG
jgi:hypothetical protein